jgi:hypothetical protein
MRLAEMSRSDKLALAALARLLLGADGTFSREEAGGLLALAQEIGPEELEARLDEAAEDLRDREAVLAAARGVTHPEAREAIYGALFELATRDTIVPAEAQLLDWLAETWQLAKVTTPYRG